VTAVTAGADMTAAATFVTSSSAAATTAAAITAAAAGAVMILSFSMAELLRGASCCYHRRLSTLLGAVEGYQCKAVCSVP
jgi:hypothetical protein